MLLVETAKILELISLHNICFSFGYFLFPQRKKGFFLCLMVDARF